ncbi:MAG: hypothetical protein EOO52_07520 [Gammaproteobacteria bacterium]|nr:MAG: hypothetical protein EOO52_07520 [Gammaproteobacteria bacterium]
MTIPNDNYNNALTSFKPRPWGEDLNSNSQAYTRPDPTSKTNIPSRDSASRSGTGSGVIPWNYAL